MTRTLLLGAGASVEAGIPAAQAMVQGIYNQMWRSNERRALDVAIAGLKFRKGATEGDPFADIDVEDLYATLQLLAERHTHHLAPFVGSWDHSWTYSSRSVSGSTAPTSYARVDIAFATRT